MGTLNWARRYRRVSRFSRQFYRSGPQPFLWNSDDGAFGYASRMAVKALVQDVASRVQGGAKSDGNRAGTADLPFASYIRRVLVTAQRDKFSMPQVVVRCPFNEFKLRHSYRR